MLFNLIISEKDARMQRGMFSGRESTAGELELERGFAGGGKNSLAARSCHCSGILGVNGGVRRVPWREVERHEEREVES